MKFAWEADVVQADRLPDDAQPGTAHGIHSVKQWNRSAFLHKPGQSGPLVFVQGAVDAYGYLKHHTDGVVRSEHVRVLALRVIDVPYPTAPCTHTRLQLVNRFIEEGRLEVGHCACSTPKLTDAGFMGFMIADEEGSAPLVSYGELTPTQLEERLCKYYEVEHLPLGVGPWLEPWGMGPTLIPEGEDRVVESRLAPS